MKGQVFKPLVEGPTWREIIVEALRATELDTCMWSEETRGELADHVLAAMRRHARYGPL